MGRKALKRRLGKKALSGDLTVDEARARLGRKVSQKAAYKVRGRRGLSRRPPTSRVSLERITSSLLFVRRSRGRRPR